MKKILTNSAGRVCEIKNPGEEFPVHPDLTWRDGPDDVSDRHTWDGAQFIAPLAPSPEEIAAVVTRAIRAEAERRLTAGIIVNAKPFKADDASVLRMNLLAGGLAASAPGTMQAFRTAAGDTFTVDAAQAAAISRAQIGYVGAMLAASAALQASPPADPTADVHWPIRPNVIV